LIIGPQWARAQYDKRRSLAGRESDCPACNLPVVEQEKRAGIPNSTQSRFAGLPARQEEPTYLIELT